MSRAQINQNYGTASDESKSYYNEAQNSYTNANNDAQDYKAQLSAYKAGNPYGEGGAFQTDTNKVVANTADAAARSAGSRLQDQALRTGQNTAGDVAATENMTQQGTRDISGEEAEANQERIGAGANYGKSVLGATEFPAQFAEGMASGMAGQGNTSLGIAQKDASWTDPAADAWNKAAAGAAEHFANDESKNLTSGGGGDDDDDDDDSDN